MAVDTIRKGIGELEAGESIGAGRVRRLGAGRKPLSETDPELLVDLERLVEADRRGDRESLLLWSQERAPSRRAGCASSVIKSST
jgi:hypothetical protein